MGASAIEVVVSSGGRHDQDDRPGDTEREAGAADAVGRSGDPIVCGDLLSAPGGSADACSAGGAPRVTAPGLPSRGSEALPPRHGSDRVDIRLREGTGESRSISRSASGGELARLMLAIEVVIAGSSGDGVPTLVFDEVDSGVGGAAALAVGARLAALARGRQVVVVTHLAQVAAYADRHLVVHKVSDEALVQSNVVTVDGPARLAELSRMMGGDPFSKAGLAHAKDLLAQVDTRATRERSG